jgi:hypothetical protein
MEEAMITDEEFLSRAQAHYTKQAGLSQEHALACAEAVRGAWVDNGRDDETPEEYVNADLDCWDDDGGDE